MIESKPIDMMEEVIKALDLLPSWADAFDVLGKIEEMKQQITRLETDIKDYAYNLDQFRIENEQFRHEAQK